MQQEAGAVVKRHSLQPDGRCDEQPETRAAAVKVRMSGFQGLWTVAQMSPRHQQPDERRQRAQKGMGRRARGHTGYSEG